MFYSLPVLHKFLLSKSNNFRDLLLFARANFVLLLLPVLYWGMRSIFWPEEVAYHDVSPTNLLKTISFVLVSGGSLLIIFALQLKLRAKKQSLQVIFAGTLSVFLEFMRMSFTGLFHQLDRFF